MEKSQLFKRTAIAAALLAPSFAAYATTSPFSALPLHMSGHTVSKAPPNVLLILDNSGSMQGIAETDSVWPTLAKMRHFCETLWPTNFGSNYYARYTVSNEQIGYGSCQVYRRSDNARINNAYRFWFCPSYNDLRSLVNSRGWAWVYGNTSLARIPSSYRSNSWDSNTCTLTNDAAKNTRIETLKETMTAVINDPANNNVRWGVDYINNNAINQSIRVPLGGNNKTAMLNSINTVVASGGTPFTSTYINSTYSNFVAGNAIQYRCQKNFVIALTDGEANGGISPSSTQTTWFRNNWSKTKTPLTFATWSSNGSIYNADHGLEALSSILANSDLRTTGTDLEGGSWDDPTFKVQNVITSTVGFGIDNNYLKNGAQGDGSNYYSAKNAQQLTDAFNQILNTANTSSKNASVTPSVNSSSSTTLGALSLTLDLTKANSTFQFTNLARNPTGGQSTPTIDSSKSIKFGNLVNNSADSDRRVLISALGIAPKFLAKEDVNWAGYSDTSTIKRQDVVDWLIRNSSKSDRNINTNLRERDENNPVFPKRMMGDVVGGSVLQVGSTASNNYNQFLVTAANDGMVHILRNTSNNSQPFELKANWIVGAAAREAGSSDATIWQAVQNTLLPNYVSDLNNAHTYLINGGLTYRTTANGHHFAVGTLGQGGKGAYAFNIGGNRHDSTSTKVGIDASQSSWPSSIPLWETANNTFAAPSSDSNTQTANQRLGYTVGSPVIDRVATARNSGAPVFNNSSTPIRYIAAVSNGYSGSDTLPALYIYDALGLGMTYTVDGSNRPTATAGNSYSASNAGKLLAKIVVPNDAANSAVVSVVTDDGKTQINNGLSAPALVDVNSDGVADVAYAGDLNGNMYRFDLRGATPSQWVAKRIFKGDPKNPITAAPSVYRMNSDRIIVMFGTGRDLHSSDLTNTETQYFYGVYDDLTNANPTDVTRANMLQQTLTSHTVGSNSYLTLSETKLDNATHRGWFIQLSTGTGERVVVQPTVVDNAVFFSTRIYNQAGSGMSSQVCSKSNSSGYSRMLGASVLDGGNVSRLTTNFGQITLAGVQTYYSGFQTAGIVSATGFSYNTTRARFSRNEQGQSQDGEDADLTNPTPSDRKTNFCAADSSGDLYYADSESGAQGQYLHNRECSVKRISWREIF